ncbi:lipoamide acyltransferase component of branched-chain alpha-keto acid dehydrogenase complex [Steroidobacter agaridevorans]|uniref:Dihydrolipoamide acetyltransferase component of pyruvate dehydrogenase complex n=1 Tax=Steroidobacter agaridevorans TaxID=2695856 RepID=A0A829YG02_9GAMM|nr:dihydrolipoamide acetyltransferase family protein [Steroidobacter agaridevorans]GFE81741.1 lipoamide acyltransferase component of branched-chain alpha-keto acid dehydrogenase complex [Steroidobacter agaridevorans]
MSRHVVKLPDLGEGTVSSEVVAWKVKVGDVVGEDQPIVEMSTDKAVVELPAPVGGKVVSLGGQPGDQIAVGGELYVLETDASAAVESAPAAAPAQAAAPANASSAAAARNGVAQPATAKASGGRVMASPATRARAKLAGIDLTTVSGSGRDGRIQRQDLDAAINDRQAGKAPAPASTPSGRQVRTGTEEIRILGVRRVSAQRVADSKRNIPHFAYVEEVDMTELERLRKHLNSQQPKGSPSYTYLPFLAMALVRVVEQFPKVNSRYDAERNVLIRHDGVHIGVATQTSDGLKVPVVKHAESLSLKEIAAEIRRVTNAAREGTASRNELQGSTITITSLGKLGGIVSTPIINAPEVAIVGINKAVERPVIVNGEVAVRLMMNLSSSFDHRFIDGYDAAETIQALKEKLEQPATIFIRD